MEPNRSAREARCRRAIRSKRGQRQPHRAPPVVSNAFQGGISPASWTGGSSAKRPVLADVSVWLECSGELIDVGSVDVLRLRETKPGIELVEFACPRCGTPHSSLRFA
jgi:hypothetical protein